ncbi:MAG: FHA domain-containing protein [Crocosphaera sp.]
MTARLISKVPNAPVPEFPITNNALIGIFTQEYGPVDIDLEHFLGNETISKQHAEIIYENGTWMVKDSSTNGTYIKPFGQTRFGARIMGPTPLNDGDEVAFAKVVFTFKSP